MDLAEPVWRNGRVQDSRYALHSVCTKLSFSFFVLAIESHTVKTVDVTVVFFMAASVG